MRKRLSPALISQVKKLLPELRKETEAELALWGDYVPGPEFYMDEKVLKALPFAAYEYIYLGKRITVDKSTIIEWLNDDLFNEDNLKAVIAHTLRRLAIFQ